jgi:hypothetical protein
LISHPSILHVSNPYIPAHLYFNEFADPRFYLKVCLPDVSRCDPGGFVPAMFQHSRHFTPTFGAWEPTDAGRAITEITDDALSNVDVATLWSAHPMDDGVRDGNGTLYFGAAGVVWALDYLRRVQAITYEQDLSPLLEIALSRNAPWFAGTAYSSHASLLMGDLGILLVQMRIAPDSGVADEIYALLAANTELPIVELMWGLPGCMLGCSHMQEMSAEARFMQLFQLQAARLLAELEMDPDGPIWTQELYGRRQRWLGPVHGFAGTCCRFFVAGTYEAAERWDRRRFPLPKSRLVHRCGGGAGPRGRGVPRL